MTPSTDSSGTDPVRSGVHPGDGAAFDWAEARFGTAGDAIDRALLERALGELPDLCARLGSEEAEDVSRRLGWLVGVLASSSAIDFVRARRDADGLESALLLVGRELGARGVELRFRGARPRTVGGPRENWRLPACLMHFVWAAASPSLRCAVEFERSGHDAAQAVALRLEREAHPTSPLLPPAPEFARNLTRLAPGVAVSGGGGTWSCSLPEDWVRLEGTRPWSG